MADSAKLKKQDKTEISRVDHGKNMAQALIDGMIQNPDKLLRGKGGGRFDVYTDLLRDDQVKSTYQQRRSAVISSEWFVDSNAEEDQETEQSKFLEWQLKKLKFDQLTDKMLYAVYYGFAVAEIILDYDETTGWIYAKDIKVRDRNRFKFDADHNLVLYESGQKTPLPQNKFWVVSTGANHSDNPYGEGLAHSLYWPVFFKRNGIKFWMIYLEKYGMPTAMANLSRSQFMDPEQRGIALDILDAIHADSGVVKPSDIETELLEASRSGSASYEKLYEKMDAAISKIVLSQTMTTDNGSSRSQAEVHAGVKDDVIKTDADLVCETFNTQVVKQLIDLNFAETEFYPEVWRRTEPEQDLKDIAERDTKIKSLGLKPTEQYIRDTYGDGWIVDENANQPPPMSGEENNPEFSESGLRAQQSNIHRQDQHAINGASAMLATAYNQMLTPKIEGILALAEESGDLEALKENLFSLLEETSTENVNKIQRASFAARMAGLFKGRSK